MYTLSIGIHYHPGGMLVETLAVLCTVMMASGQILLKSGLTKSGFSLTKGISGAVLSVISSPRVLFGVLLYLVSAVLWIWILSQRPLSYIYPFLALSFGFALIGSSLFLGEKVNMTQWIGVVVIALGIFLVSRINI